MDFWQICEACRERFLSPKRNVRWCASCRAIHEQECKEARSLLDAVRTAKTAALREKAWESFWEFFRCTCPRREWDEGKRKQLEEEIRKGNDTNKCMWEGEGHREKTDNLGKLYLLVEKWVASDLRHRMHHAWADEPENVD